MYRLIKTISILFITIVVSFNLSAQDEHHLHFKYEIGLSNGLVYNFTEEETAYGLHIHVIKNFGISSKVGVGIGYEAIFDEHKHNTLSVLLHYKPIEHFSINLAPGILFLESEPDKSRFALHVEAIYEFEIGVFHFGPLLGMGFNPEDSHASIGLHVAIGI